MIEMLPAEFHLQLYRDLKAILPKLEAQERADKAEIERKDIERIKRVQKAYDTAVERKNKMSKQVFNDKYQRNLKQNKVETI
ncbi:hypothetical protein AGMMS50276_27460 [Synergistales bacterium]|nr:hypothetical protein AGMMS50276_27460 [Synergistales bacterium]